MERKSKINNIKHSFNTDDELNQIYDFRCMTTVLDIGLGTDKFKDVEYMDFDTVLDLIDLHFRKN